MVLAADACGRSSARKFRTPCYVKLRAPGCRIAVMSENPADSTQLRSGYTMKLRVIVCLMWCGWVFVAYAFLKWVMHVSSEVYWYLIPWTVVGPIFALRPDWRRRFTLASDGSLERGLEQFDKRPRRVFREEREAPNSRDGRAGHRISRQPHSQDHGAYCVKT